MVDLDALREALDIQRKPGARDRTDWLLIITDAAREYLREHESEGLRIVKENGSWPAWPLAWISDLLGGTPNMREDLEPLLDALAAAQPGREAE